MQNFSTTPMGDIINILQEEVKNISVKEIISFEVLNPDIISDAYNGTKVFINEKEYIYRGFKSWMDLAHQLKCKILMPQAIDENFILIRYEKLNEDVSFHTADIKKEEKYGEESIFSQIHKNEEASFIYYYKQALKNAHVDKRLRILNLGVNSGDEFEALLKESKNFDALELLGIDYCPSAIKKAEEKFKEYENIKFLEYDINRLNELNLEKFDLIITIGTLQSSNLEFHKLLMSIVQNQLKKDGAMILGFPNCRWINGEMIYGARVKNYSFSEMGLLYKDVLFVKKYLQQKKFRVTLTGKDYIFLTATSIK